MLRSALIILALAGSAPANATDTLPTMHKPKVELVFALDTTGSMGGLIEGAKQKIWFIANEALKAKQKPDVRIGLVAFRDKGDDYIVRSLPLTSDLDKVYETLMGYSADGGGDGPEHVNAALDHAINRMQWSEGKDVLRLVFLVGDAPPHMDYNDDVKHDVTSRIALKKNIYIHTIQCGSDSSTTTVWQQIARNSEGRYAAIAQDGGVVAIATPYDEELRRLATELDATTVTYGRRDERAKKESAMARASGFAAAAPAATAADRAVVKSKMAMSDESESDDLVSLYAAKGDGAALSVAQSELPPEMAAMNKTEQKKYLDDQRVKRENVSKKITEVSKQRDAFVATEHAKRGGKDGFDSEVVLMVKDSAKKVGLEY